MQHTYTREEVLEALDTVLRDNKFAAAPQMSAFLKYVVHQTLEGRAGRIKAYTVAVDGLGKPTTFDPKSDPSVRVLAKRLRDTLTAYYQRTTGHNLVLLLRAGSYVPSFVTVEYAEAVRQQAAIPALIPVSSRSVPETSNPVRSTLDERTSFSTGGNIKSPSVDNYYGFAPKLQNIKS